MDFEQGELNFDSPATDAPGYRKWREEMDRRKKEIESRFGVILGKPVELYLTGEDTPLRGTLSVVSKTLPETRSKLLLQLASRQFTLAQIKSISRL